MRGRLALVAVLALGLSGGGAGATGGGRIVYTMTIDSLQLYRVPPGGHDLLRVTRNVWGSDDAAVSPDGQTLLFDADPNGSWDVFARRLPGGVPVDLTPGVSADDYEPAWSPDGSRIAFISSRASGTPQLFVMNADGTGVRRLTDDGASDELPSWSPDGSTITFDTSTHTTNGDLWAIGADGGGLRRLTTSPRDEWGARWSPDGQWLVFVTEGAGGGYLFLVHPDGSAEHQIRTGQAGDDLGYPAWSPDGKTIAYADLIGDCGIYTIAPDGTQRKLVVDLCYGNVSTFAADAYNLSWAPDGSFWFSNAPIGARDLATVGADGGGGATLTATDEVSEDQPAWSPDGTTIAYTSDAGPTGDIWLMNPDGSQLRDLTRSHKSDDQEPAWSPDGAQIAFATDRGKHGHVEIYLMRSDGSHERPLTTLAGDNFEPAWSPDGQAVAFANAYRKRLAIYVEHVDGTGLRRLGPGEEAAWSPNGRTIAYLRQGHVWRMRADGSGARPLAAGAGPSWSPDGTQIVFQRTFVAGKDGMKRDELWVMDAHGRGLRRLVVACDDAMADDSSFVPDCGRPAGARWGP